MDEQQAAAAVADAEHYREIARKLRGIAQECRFAKSRQELLDLAGRYERRAHQRTPFPFFSDQALATGRCRLRIISITDFISGTRLCPGVHE